MWCGDRNRINTKGAEFISYYSSRYNSVSLKLSSAYFQIANRRDKGPDGMMEGAEAFCHPCTKAHLKHFSGMAAINPERTVNSLWSLISETAINKLRAYMPAQAVDGISTPTSPFSMNCKRTVWWAQYRKAKRYGASL